MGCLESDGRALLDFKTGLEDPENRLFSWKGTNCCQWKGIRCENNTGAVISVDLHNPHPYGSSSRYGFWNLSGEIRPSLMKLESLTYLDLSFNTFRGIPVPEFFASLKHLRYLNLSNAGFSGLVPPIGNLSSLQYLDFDSSSLVVKDLEWLKGLVSLKHLVMDSVDLSMVAISDWFVTLNRLPYLTDLHLSSCWLYGPIPALPYVNLTSLAVLDLSQNQLESKIPDWLVNITSLVAVNMGSNRFYGKIPLGFAALPNLQLLDLGMNRNLTASCSQLFGGRWEKIRVVEISGDRLHGKLPASIGNLTFLTVLDLSYNDIQGGIPSSIGKLCNLEVFSLASNNLTGTLPQFPQGAENCLSRSPLKILALSFNQLVGNLPEWLGQFENLVELSLSNNMLSGPIPTSLGSLQNLGFLGLGSNRLNGTLPSSIGQLSKLYHLDVSSNHLSGMVTETHFLKLGWLGQLYLSSNSFLLNVSSNWVPPFQVWRLMMGSCHLGPPFPARLKSQKDIEYLDFSNASISGSIPFWFWEIASGVYVLNVSFNQLEGQLPRSLNTTLSASLDFSNNLFQGPIPLPTVNIEILDLSNNKLSGRIPENISGSLPCVLFLSLSGNRIEGEIPASIGNMQCLKVIDLSSNNFEGSIPQSIGNCSYLEAIDLSNNNLSGKIPSSLGDRLSLLKTLHLSDNKLVGEIPSSFRNLSSLETLDLGNNRLTGRLPRWIGESFENLRALILRSNAFCGELPSVLSNLSSLQVLDLAENQFNDSIPASFGNFEAMTRVQLKNKYLLYGMYRNVYYKENLVVNMKGQTLTYTRTLSLVISLDLSCNNLSGDIPEEITKLLGLVALNLSRNHISGHIPVNISKLRQLSSLDLSRNRLSGPIPDGLSLLSFLGLLNLSNNDLSGAVPYSGHMTTFGASSFSGNPGLCGAPLDVRCAGDNDPETGRSFEEKNNSGEFYGLIDKYFYLSVGLGFAVGLLVPFLVMSVRKSWSNAYFGLVDKVVETMSFS
ncbi:hypothetical protein TIFTF001_022779 [Ficus carica]|uniref:Leucine-rich repeat-containing N-terminal plant-type domain-containing protein n=1 Tax=Ficus carica TaxID=3494 RepID=A0AA88DEV0_FICCA|nr:hypothetical protein TIFTF001_022779 [Ficus carica]